MLEKHTCGSAGKSVFPPAMARQYPDKSRFAPLQRCPFLGDEESLCRASVSALSVGARRLRQCCSEDFDSCAIFLAYLLRRMRPKRTDGDWLDVA